MRETRIRNMVLGALRTAPYGVTTGDVARIAQAPGPSVRRVLGELRLDGFRIDVIGRRPSGNVLQLVEGPRDMA